MNEHEPTETPNWDTKIVCTCGERCSHWMEFYRHRGDAYKRRAESAEAALRELVVAFKPKGNVWKCWDVLAAASTEETT